MNRTRTHRALHLPRRPSQTTYGTINRHAFTPNLGSETTIRRRFICGRQEKYNFNQALVRTTLLHAPVPRYPTAMPLPVRYAQQVPEIARVWEPAGYFEAQ